MVKKKESKSMKKDQEFRLGEEIEVGDIKWNYTCGYHRRK